MTLYDHNGNEKAKLQANDSSTQDKEVQADNVLSLGFTLYEHVSIDVNDYVEFCGERYWAVEKYEPTEKSSVEWEYSVRLYGIESLIKRFLVLNNADDENEAVFTLTARPVDHVRLIVKCINDGMGTTNWKVGSVEGTDHVVIRYEGKYCDEALKELAEAVGVEWWIEGETVNLSRCEWGSAVVLGYGEGLTSLEQDKADNAKFYTRLYPIGSSRNIDRERYGASRLQLPGGVKYVDIADLVAKYGVIHHYEQEAFSGIYPRRVGIVSSVRSENVEDSDGKPFTIYYFKDNELTFDPNDYEIGGLVKHVSFEEGSELAGLGADEDHYFEVNFNSETREFEIITIWPYDDDRQLPGGTLIPKPGDKYILWNIRMPEDYYTLAEEEYLSAVEEYNRKHSRDVSRYKGGTDHVWIEETDTELEIGRRVRLKSAEYFPGQGYRDSRITRISRSVNLPSLMDLEISDAISTGAMAKIEDSIDDVKDYVRESSSALPDIIRSWDTTKPTDNNLYSARRTHKEFLSKTADDRAQGNIRFEQNVSVGGDAAVHGGLAVTGASEFGGDELHAGVETHLGLEVHEGEECHAGREEHAGDEEHGGNVSMTHRLSIGEDGIAEILGAMFLGRSEAFVSGVYGNGGRIGKNGNGDWRGELDSLFVRKLATLVRGVFNELVSSHPTSKVGEWFEGGFNGHGAKVWYDGETGWNMELDTLTVRRIMYIFELVIQKIRSVGGILIVSAANGKIKDVQKVLVRNADGGSGGTAACGEGYECYYKITFEDTNTFVRHDLMRCQRWNNGRYGDVTKADDAELPDARAMQYYWVEVGYPDSSAFSDGDKAETPTIYQATDDWELVVAEGDGSGETPRTQDGVVAEFSAAYDILVARSEFGKTVEWTDPETEERMTLPADTEPEVGDECVLMGNTRYAKRQNYIYISATEDGVPRIDVMDGCKAKGDGGNLRCRLGCLDGINDAYWGLEQPHGYGLYSDNAWLKGKFIVRIGDRDRDVSTMFEVLDGMIRSSISSLREDTIGGEGCISNNVFTDGLDKWGIYGNGQLLTNGKTSASSALHDGGNFMVFLGFAEYAKLVEDNGTYAVEMKGTQENPRGIMQKMEDMHDVPTFEEDSGGNPVARTFAVSFYARSEEANGTNVVVGIGGQTFSIAVAKSEKFRKYVHTLDLTSVGDFKIYTYGGAVQVRGIVVSVDIDEAMIDRLVSKIEQIPDSITGIVEAFEEGQDGWQLKEFSTFKLGYGEWQTSVTDNFRNTNSKIDQLSNSITSSIQSLVPINENDYIVDPTFERELTHIKKWNITDNTSAHHLVFGSSTNGDYIDILCDSASAPIGFYPDLQNVPSPTPTTYKAVEISIAIRCINNGLLIVEQDDGNGGTIEIYRKSLTASTTYQYVRFNASWRYGNIYIGILGVNSQVYINSVCMANEGKAQLAELSSRITQTQDSIGLEVTAQVQSATATINTQIAKLQLTADGITARVEANSDNRIFSRLTSDFDYYDAFSSLDPEDVPTLVYEYTTPSDKKVLHIESEHDSPTAEYVCVNLGLLPTAKEYDGEKITVVLKAFAALQTSGRIRIKYNSGNDDYVDITNAFSQTADSDGLYEATAVINTFNYNYGIKIGVWGDGVLDIYSIVGLVDSRSSIISQTRQSILSAVASNYVSSSSLSGLVSAYLTANGYATNNDISTAIAVSGMMTTDTFNTIFSAFYDPNTGDYTIASAISTSVKYTEVDGQKIMQGDVAISASNIHLEGYTTINGNFRVDEDGNAVMNDCTIAGVLNNLIQEQEFESTADIWTFNPLRWGSIIECAFQGNSGIFEMRLPSLYSKDNGDVCIEYDDGDTFAGMTSNDLRQCIGKKYYLFGTVADTSKTLRVRSRFLVEVANRVVSFGSPSNEGVIEPNPSYTYDKTNHLIDVSSTNIVILTCCLGEFNNKECIYWELERSMMRSDTVIYVYGRLVNRSNAGLPDVYIQFTHNGSTEECITDEQGFYACKVTADTTYRVTAYKSSSISIESVTGQDLTAFMVHSNSVGLNLVTTNN